MQHKGVFYFANVAVHKRTRTHASACKVDIHVSVPNEALQVLLHCLIDIPGHRPLRMLRLTFVCGAALTHAAVLEGIFEHLAQQFHDIPTSVVEAAVANSMAKALEVEGVPPSDVVCVRDYSAVCPEGWADQGDGETCSAPMHYQGPCSKVTNYASLSPTEKRVAASACGSQFPCVDSCTMDFDSLCPDGWDEDSANHCVAPLKYAGPCVGRKDFREVSTSDKSHWASVCNVRWPCRRQQGAATDSGSNRDCVQEFSSACPDGWTTVGSQCVGPVDYQGPCATMIGLSGLTVDQKGAYAKVCKTPWPCSSDRGHEGGVSFLQYSVQDTAASGAHNYIIDSKLRVSQLNFAKKEISKLVPRVKAGGRMATKALARLVSLTSDPNAKSVMIGAGVVAAAETLMKRPDTSDRNIGLAGSILTMLSGMPVAVEVADEKTGADGHVDIIIPRPSRVYKPDKVILQLSSGMRPGQ